LFNFKQNETKLNKNNEYKNQIEYKTWTLTHRHCWVDTWTFFKI